MKTIENITIKRGNGYGQYIITGKVNGIELKAHTTDSEAFDYLDDDDYPEKQEQAFKHCEWKLEQAYDNQIDE